MQKTFGHKLTMGKKNHVENIKVQIQHVKRTFENKINYRGKITWKKNNVKID